MRLLDLFCGAGGAATGYYRAGFDEIFGIDIVPQPNYPFAFMQADVFEPWVGNLVRRSFDLIHASPPCQAYSAATVQHRHRDYPDLVADTRRLLVESGQPWIIENVPGAPLINPVQICGSGLGMVRLRRHRWFEASWPLMGVPCVHGINKDILSVSGHGEGGSHRGGTKRGLHWGTDAKREAMGIDWMNREEMAEAIPPTFTEYLGRQFLDQLARTA